MIRLSALNDKMMRKLIANGVPERIAAFVSDDVNGFPHSSRKFLARAMMENLASYAERHPEMDGEDLMTAFLEGGMQDLMLIRDWLSMGDEPDGSPINMHLHKTLKDMYVAAEKWHDRLAEQNTGGHPSLYGPIQTEDLMIQFPDGWKLVNVPSQDLKNEGSLMGHCVGGEDYEAAVRRGGTKIVSLRDPRGWPHATIEIKKDPHGTNWWDVRQVQGKGNAPLLDKYKPYVRQFLEYKSDEIENVDIPERDWKMLQPTAELLEELAQTEDKKLLGMINEQELVPFYLHKIEQATSRGGDVYENLWTESLSQDVPHKVSVFAGNHPEIPQCKEFVLAALESPEWRVSMFGDIGREEKVNIFDFMSHRDALPLIKGMLANGQTYTRRLILQRLPQELVRHPAFRDTLLALNGDSEVGDAVYQMLEHPDSLSAGEIAEILKHYHRNVIARTHPAFPNMNLWLMELRRRDPEKFLEVMDMLPLEAQEILGDNPIFMNRRFMGTGNNGAQTRMEDLNDQRPIMEQSGDLERVTQREDWILKNRLQRNRREYQNRPEPPTQHSLMETVALLDYHGMHRHADRLEALISEV